jgi:hypothetical protein
MYVILSLGLFFWGSDAPLGTLLSRGPQFVYFLQTERSKFYIRMTEEVLSVFV